MIIDAIFQVGTIFIEEFTKGCARAAVREIVRYCINSCKENNLSKQTQYSTPNNRSSKDVTNELEIIDAEFIELEHKKRRNGFSSRGDQERKKELELLRANKFKEYQETKSEEIVEEQSTSPENYGTSALSDNSAHLLQYHMGQIVLGKKCKKPQCGRPMFLQSKQRFDGSLYSLNDFFWSCTGFYNKPPFQCRGAQRFQVNDIGFLHKADIFEFQVSNHELSTIFEDKSIQKATVNRVKSHLQEKDNDVLCPIHYVPMILREKRDHQGTALDMFFLCCPHLGCQQLVKLKSPAQLAAYLTRKEERGIL